MPSKKTGRRQQRECSSSAWLCSSWVFRPTSDPLWVRVLERHWPLARHVEPTGGYSAGSQEFPKQPPQPPSVRQDRKQTMHRSEDLLFLFQSDLRTEPCAAQRLLHIRPHCTSDCGSVVLLLHAFLYPQPFRRDPGSTLQPVASSHLCFTTWTGVAHLPPGLLRPPGKETWAITPPPLPALAISAGLCAQHYWDLCLGSPRLCSQVTAPIPAPERLGSNRRLHHRHRLLLRSLTATFGHLCQAQAPPPIALFPRVEDAR